MAAASVKSPMRAALAMSRDVSVARVRDMSMACAACALVGGGAAALLALSTLSRQNAALCMSGLTLMVMMAVPLLMSCVAGLHALAASAVALVTTMSAMNTLPAYLKQSEQGTGVAALAMAAGVLLLIRYLRTAESRSIALRESSQPHHLSTRTPVALLAFLAGMSSGVLAHSSFIPCAA
ncbi:MAG: hypothetical protein CPDRYMAC_0320 [uncultured Paraburkholderia sp.]|nr:MAG: hypothetical protein CPDRYDRY_0291 [uncultured Paraburkholderia sp.]CAH2911402.1 MAG: hypothetical protein CPDRYMAC_0320 [uncultured Paraburkholderia sp.]